MKNSMLLSACRAMVSNGREGSNRLDAGPVALGWHLERAALSTDEMHELCERLDEADALRPGGAAPPISGALREMLVEYEAVLCERRRPGRGGGANRNLPRA